MNVVAVIIGARSRIMIGRPNRCAKKASDQIGVLSHRCQTKLLILVWYVLLMAYTKKIDIKWAGMIAWMKFYITIN